MYTKIEQCCAGSGKTYRIAQLPFETNFSLYIFITKMNSAKFTITQELRKHEEVKTPTRENR